MNHNAILLALALLASPFAQAEPARPDIAHFAHTGQFERFLLSPDGTRAAGIVRVKDQRLLVHQKADGSERRIGIAMDKPDHDLELLRWLGPKHLLVRVVNHAVLQEGALPFPSSRLLALPVDGGRWRVLTPQTEIHVNHLSQTLPQACPAADHVLMPEPRADEGGGVSRFDAAHADAVGAAAPLDGVRGQWWADAQGRVRLALRLHPDGSRELLQRAPDASAWTSWRRFSAAEFAAVQVLGFDADPNQLLLRAPQGEAAAVLRWRLDREAPAEVLHTLGTQERVLRLLRNEADCSAVGAEGTVGAGLHLWGERLAALQAGVARALPERELRLQQWQGSRYVMRASSAAEPAEFLVGDRSAGTLARSSWPLWPLAGQLKLTSTLLGDGSRLWHPPGERRALPLAVCLECELHPSDQRDAFRPLRALLLSRGYAVLEPRLPSGALLPLDRLQLPLATLDHALAAARASGWVEGERVALLARGDWGGHLALRWAAQRPVPLRAVVVAGALANLERLQTAAEDERFGASSRRSMRALLGGLKGESLQAVNPVQQAAALRAPTLLLHGDRDARLPAHHSEDLHTALQQAGVPSRLMRFARSDSQLDHPPYRHDALQAIEAWLLKYL